MIKRNGFTLIELLIVISIIGIFSGFLFVSFAGVRERGRDAQRKNDLRQIKNALRLYYNDYQSYPEDQNGVILGCGSNGQAACAWGANFSAGSTNYMVLPTDPINTGEHVYLYGQLNGESDSFTLTAVLENLADTQAAESQMRCGVDSVDVVDGVYMICEGVE